MFQDEKASGFDVDATHRSDPKRLDTLLRATAVAVLWMDERGAQVLRDARRTAIDPSHTRQVRVVQLGWRQVRRARRGTVLPAITLLLRPFKPAPVYNRRLNPGQSEPTIVHQQVVGKKW